MLRRPRRITALAACALTALTTACTVAEETTGPDATPATGSGPVTGSVPAEFVGGWRYGSVSPTNFWDDHTGVYSGNAYGMSNQYIFGRDGSFKEYIYIYTQSYGCQMQAWVEMSGAVRFDDASFTTQVTGGRFKTIDTCASSHNKDRAMTDAERRERSGASGYAARTDAAGRAYLEILEARFDRVQQ